MAVIRHLAQSQQALYAAIRANRTWFGIGFDLLWRQPPYNALRRLDMRPRERRQFYANRMQFVPFFYMYDAVAHKRSEPTFPALRRIDMVEHSWQPNAATYPVAAAVRQPDDRTAGRPRATRRLAAEAP